MLGVLLLAVVLGIPGPLVASWPAATPAAGASGDGISAAAWDEAAARLPLATLPAPGPGSAGKRVPRPEAVSWEAFSRDPPHQGGTGTCALFAEVAALEVQYAIDNCDAPDAPRPSPAGCPVRPTDDDPSLAGRRQLTLDDDGRLWVDLSEQLILSCSGLGFAWGGTAVWPFMNEAGANRMGQFDPERPYDLKYARTGWGYWQWLARVGTVVEAIAPYRLPYLPAGRHDYDAAYAALLDRGDPDPFPGTCPLVHRFGAGDPDGLGSRAAPEPLADDGCEIAQVAARAGAGSPVFFRTPLTAHRAIAERELLDWLAAGYVVVDVVGGRLSPEPGRPGRVRCDLSSCRVGENCRGHVVLLVGYERHGETLIVRDSLGSFYRIRRLTCGHGVDHLVVLLSGDDPAAPDGPAITTHETTTCADGEHRELHRWLRDDADGDGIRNGWDVCLYSPNGRLIDREAAGDDPRIAGEGRLREPRFEDGDAWPDELLPLGEDEWDPARGRRTGCDSCPRLTAAQPATFTATPEGFAEDPDPWGWVCDGCPFTPQWSLDEYLAAIPTDENDPDEDGVTVCDTCGTPPHAVRSRDPRGLLDIDGDGLGAACDDWEEFLAAAPPAAQGTNSICSSSDAPAGSSGGGSGIQDSTPTVQSRIARVAQSPAVSVTVAHPDGSTSSRTHALVGRSGATPSASP